VYIDAPTDIRFYVKAPFSKYGAAANYYISPSYVGDTPPAGYSMTITAAGLIQITLPSIASFTSAVINFALNAPAVGTNFPLSVDGTQITGGLIPAANLPLASSTASGALNYYQQDDTTLASVTWGFSTPTSAFAVKVTRVGRVVTLLFPSAFNGTSAGGALFVALSTNLPAFARPSTNLAFNSVFVSNNVNVAAPGEILVLSTGEVRIYYNNGVSAWPNVANSGTNATSVSYSV
jgi:hypothetical protein